MFGRGAQRVGGAIAIAFLVIARRPASKRVALGCGSLSLGVDVDTLTVGETGDVEGSTSTSMESSVATTEPGDVGSSSSASVDPLVGIGTSNGASWDVGGSGRA